MTRFLYRMASLLSLGSAIASGNPRRIRRRLVNRAKARALYRLGFWK